MARSLGWLRKLRFTVLCAVAAAILVGSDQRLELPHPAGPLHVATMWWAPEAAGHGVHAVHGKVVNTTHETWENVQVSIDFQNVHGESLFVRTVALGRVAPGEPTRFTTGPVPQRAARIALLAIAGTLRSQPPGRGDTRPHPAAPGAAPRPQRRSRKPDEPRRRAPRRMARSDHRAVPHGAGEPPLARLAQRESCQQRERAS